jgi:nondiscriminating aspartyl-tRNA synthetase
MLRTHYSQNVDTKDYGSTITVAGWIEDIRNLGGIAFLILRDKTGKIQVTVLKKETPELFKELVSLPRETVVSITGLCQGNTQVMNNWEILPKQAHILSLAESPLPLGVIDKVGADFDTQLDNRFIDLRKKENHAIFSIRDAFLTATHNFLHSHGFLEIHTPKITTTSPEGGTEVFSLQYFDRKAYLVQSPQLYKQIMMATGFDRVYEIAWYFRAEEHDTSRHLNESTAIDVEMAFIDTEEDIMKMAEKLIQHIMIHLTTHKEREMNMFSISPDVPQIPFARITYDEALELIQKKTEMTWGDDFGTMEERLIGEAIQETFYFITKYPLETKPFYSMPNGKYARSFDLSYRGVEIASGAQRIHQHDLLKRRMAHMSMDTDNFSEYLQAFRYGMPPHGGFGFGIERFLMELLQVGNIRKCILFPRDRNRLTP